MQCENAQEIKYLRNGGQNPQSKWKALKEDIKKIAITTAEEGKKKASKNVKGLKRDMNTQSKRVSSKNMTEANRERAREELIFLKNS